MSVFAAWLEHSTSPLNGTPNGLPPKTTMELANHSVSQLLLHWNTTNAAIKSSSLKLKCHPNATLEALQLSGCMGDATPPHQMSHCDTCLMLTSDQLCRFSQPVTMSL